MGKQKSSKKVILWITIPLVILLITLSTLFMVRQTMYTSIFLGATMKECDDNVAIKESNGYTCEIKSTSDRIDGKKMVCKAVCKKSDETEAPNGWYRCKPDGKLEQMHNGEWTPYRYCDYYNNKENQCKYADSKYSSIPYTLCEEEKIVETYFCYHGECLSYEKYQDIWISDYTVHSTMSSCNSECGEEEPSETCSKEYIGDSYCKTDGNVYRKQKQTDCSVNEVLIDTCSDDEFCKDSECILIEDQLPEEEEQQEEYITQFVKVCHPKTGEEGDIYWMDSEGKAGDLVSECEGECQYDNDGEPECLDKEGKIEGTSCLTLSPSATTLAERNECCKKELGSIYYWSDEKGSCIKLSPEELEDEIIEGIKDEIKEFEIDKVTLSIIIAIFVVLIIASVFYFKKPNKKKGKRKRK